MIMSKLTKLGKVAQELEKAFKEAQAGAIPLNVKRAKPKTPQEITEAADRVARQQMGEHVTSGKKGDTKNLAGRSMKEAKRLQDLQYNLERTKKIQPSPEVTGNVGEVNLAVPGDQTISDFRLLDVNGLPIESTQEGGARYGWGHIDKDDPLFWASNLGPARNVQKKTDRLSQYFNTDDVMAHHMAMGPQSNNFAMHFADANLRAINNAGVDAKAMDAFNSVIRKQFPDFPGVENPEAAYMAMRADPEMRKFFNGRMKTPSITEPLGLPNGLDIQWAITEPELRNMEIGLTGHSVGRLKPGVDLTSTAEHGTYSHGIQGEILGHAPELAPLDISFPDASEYVKAVYPSEKFTGTMQMSLPHQKVDEQYLNELNEYYTRLRAIRGFAKGGKVDMEAEFKKADVIGMAEGGSKRKSPHGKGSERTVTPPASFPDMSTLALTGKILARKGKEQLKKELANPSPQMAVDILGNLAADIVGMPSDLIEGAKGEPINTKGRNKPYNTSTIQQGKGKPMLGSENLYAQLKNAGITSGEERPLTETALGLISPAAIAKGPKAVKALAKEAARQIETGTGLGKYMVEPRMNVVKPEGGQWSDTAREKVEKVLSDPQGNPDVTKWLKTTGRKYMLNRMGSPEDEVRKLLDKDISHIDPKRLSEMGRDINQSDKDYIRAKRRVAGFPQEGLADTAAGKRWELMTDEYINPNPASVYQDKRFTSEAPWAENLDPDTPIYSGERGTSYLFNETGMTEIANALNRAIKDKTLKPEQLNKVSMEDAVKLTHEQRVKDESELARDLPKVAEYPEAGMSWQELKHEDPDVLRKVLRREGDIMQNCIGNYCDDILEDGTRLFSLRDKAGNPHVNIEVRPGQRGEVEMLLKDFYPDEEIAAMSDAELMKVFKGNYPELSNQLKPDSFSPNIRQIKGKQNEKPVKDYIPYVQDFIKKQGPFKSIDDLSNAGMIDLLRAQQHGVLDDIYPTVMQELGRLFPAEKGEFGGINLTSDYGLRADTDVMLREALKGMEGNYVSPEDIITHMRAQETRPVEQGYSKYWESLNPDAKAKGGQPKRIDLETQFRLADILTR